MKKARKITIPIPGTLDWELLRRFNIITHSKSFGEAAEKIGTSQPALLKQMDDLEEFLGKKVFTTTAKYRSMELTPDGKVLKALTNQASEIFNKQIIKNIKKPLEYEKKKNLKIITTAGLSITVLPDLISEFITLYPDVKVNLLVRQEPQKINAGEVIIRGNFISQPHLKMAKILNLTVSFYASDNYLKKYGIPNSYEDLVNHKVLAYKYHDVTSTDQYALTQDTRFYLEPNIQSDFISFLVEMALRDHGILELPNVSPYINLFKKIEGLNPQEMEISIGYLDLVEQDLIVYEFAEFLKKNNKEVDNE